MMKQALIDELKQFFNLSEAQDLKAYLMNNSKFAEISGLNELIENLYDKDSGPKDIAFQLEDVIVCIRNKGADATPLETSLLSKLETCQQNLCSNENDLEEEASYRFH